MSRRLIALAAFVLFSGVVVWYASAFLQVPSVSFREAAAQAGEGEGKKKVIVEGKLAPGAITAEEGHVSFTLVDREGKTARVEYGGEEKIGAEELEKARSNGHLVEVAGHSHGDYFHATQLTIP